MLIKSLSRQAPSFGQLLHYLTRDDRPAGEPLRHNLITPDGRDLDLDRGLAGFRCPAQVGGCDSASLTDRLKSGENPPDG